MSLKKTFVISINIDRLPLGNYLSKTFLKTLAKEREIPKWSKMSKPKLIETLEGENITLNDFKLSTMRTVAKSKGLVGFNKMKREDLMKALTESDVPGMNNRSYKTLKMIAHKHGVNVPNKMTKVQLVEALQSKDIVLDNLRATELKSLAKVRGIPGYSKMTHAQLVEALETSIPEAVPGVVKPHGKLSFTSLNRVLNKAEE